MNETKITKEEIDLLNQLLKCDNIRQLGIIDEIVLRNLQIRRDYAAMEGTGRRKELLADKYNLSVETITCIIYDARYNHVHTKRYVKQLT